MIPQQNVAPEPATVGIGTLQNQIDARKTIYGGNPDALAARQGVTKAIVDAAALENVVSLKDAAARQINAAQELADKNIIEQNLDQAVALVSREKAAAMDKVMTEREKDRRKNLREVGTPTISSGPQSEILVASAGGLMPIPRPALQKMSQGGILGFRTGTTVPAATETTDEEQGALDNLINFVTENFDALGLGTVIAYDQLVNRRIDEKVVDLFKNAKIPGRAGKVFNFAKGLADKVFRRETRTATKPTERTIFSPKTGETKIPGPMVKGRELDPSAIAIGTTAAISAADTLLGDDATPITEEEQKVATEAEDKSKGQGIGQVGTGQEPSATDTAIAGILSQPTPTRKGIDKTKVSGALERTGVLGNLQDASKRDPQAAMDSQLEDYYEDVDRTGIASRLGNRLQKIEDFDAERFSPEARRRARGQAFIEGAIQGGTARTGVLAAERFGRDTQAAERAALFEYLEKDKQAIDVDRQIVKDGRTVAAQIYGDVLKERSDANKALSDVSIADIEAADREFKMSLEVDNNQRARALEALAIQSKRELDTVRNKILQGQLDLETATVIEDIRATQQALFAGDNRFVAGKAVAAERDAGETKFTKEEQANLIYYENAKKYLDGLSGVAELQKLLGTVAKDESKDKNEDVESPFEKIIADAT